MIVISSCFSFAPLDHFLLPHSPDDQLCCLWSLVSSLLMESLLAFCCCMSSLSMLLRPRPCFSPRSVSIVFHPTLAFRVATGMALVALSLFGFSLQSILITFGSVNWESVIPTWEFPSFRNEFPTEPALFPESFDHATIFSQGVAMVAHSFKFRLY